MYDLIFITMEKLNVDWSSFNMTVLLNTANLVVNAFVILNVSLIQTCGGSGFFYTTMKT